MGQIEAAIDAARRKGVGKSGPWTFNALVDVGILSHYGTPIFRVNFKTGEGLVGKGAWGSVSDQTGIRKAAAHLSKVLGGQITVSALSKKEILEKRDRARAKGADFSNPSGLPTKRTGAYRLDAGHAHIGKGLVYCKASRDSAPPLLSHSRVRCALCGKTVSSMHNPAPVWKWDKRNTRIETWFERDRAHVELLTLAGKTIVEWWDEAVQEAVEDGFLSPRDWHGSAAEYATSFGLPPKRELKKRNPPTSPVAHFLRRELMEGRTPAQALRTVARQFAGRVPRAALQGAFRAVRSELVGGLEGDRSGMSDWAGKAAMRMSTYKKFSRNPAVGRTSPTLIYGRAKSLTFDRNGHITQMTARKTEGPYKGENFVHDFKPGVRHIGLPRGTEVSAPGGRSMKLKTRAALMVGPRDIWRNFAA